MDKLRAAINDVFRQHYDAHHNQFHYTGFATDPQIQSRLDELKASVLKTVFEIVGERKVGMIKVLGQDEKHIHRATCKNCASILEYTKSEVTSKTYSDMGDGSNTYYYITCPVCGKEVDSVGK